jgi:GntR family transcriptional regulator/MocR family aminotransferase
LRSIWSFTNVQDVAVSKTSSGIELLLALDRDQDDPLHHQLERSLRDRMRDGRLPPGAAMPSTRALARQLGVSRGVVVESYEQLVAEGYLVSRPGGTTRVAPNAAPATPPRRASEPLEPEIAFHYGRPDVVEFPRDAWLRSMRRALATAPSARLMPTDARGVPELREALAAYLNRVRGTCADPERIVICGGFAQGIGLVADVLRRQRRPRVALEDPSDDTPVEIARRVGVTVVPIPVDEAGIRVEQLAASDADAVLVTAAHQFPLGGVLPAERRMSLVRWACGGPRLVIEDDYDAEYRYDREPIGAIQGLAPEQVVYIGSASKTLAPGLRLGWMLLPADLVEPIAEAKRLADRGAPALDQLAFADFLERGELDRHLRRMRPIYRRRRDRLLEALGRHLPELRPVGASAGLHVLAWLPPDVDEAAVVEGARQRGVGVDALGTYRIEGTGPAGLIFGYAHLPDASIEQGVRRLAPAITSVRGSGR